MATRETERPQWSESLRVRVSAETYAKVRQLAREREATVSGLTRLALVRYLAEEQKR
jgi:hypothetical protein